MRRYNDSIAIAAVLLLIGTSLAPAALVIDPLRTIVRADAGGTSDGVIHITNTGDTAADFHVKIENQTPEHVGWLEIEPDELSLQPGEQKSLHYKVHVPGGATGELYGRLSFSEAGPGEKSRAGMMVRTRISVPFFVRVADTEQFSGRIAELRLRSPAPVQLQVDFHNEGNVHVRPTGSCTFYRNGEEVAALRVPINAQQVPIYAGRESALPGQSTRNLTPGAYIAHVALEIPDTDVRIFESFPVHVPETN